MANFVVQASYRMFYLMPLDGEHPVPDSRTEWDLATVVGRGVVVRTLVTDGPVSIDVVGNDLAHRGTVTPLAEASLTLMVTAPLGLTAPMTMLTDAVFTPNSPGMHQVCVERVEVIDGYANAYRNTSTLPTESYRIAIERLPSVN